MCLCMHLCKKDHKSLWKDCFVRSRSCSLHWLPNIDTKFLCYLIPRARLTRLYSHQTIELSDEDEDEDEDEDSDVDEEDVEHSRAHNGPYTHITHIPLSELFDFP